MIKIDVWNEGYFPKRVEFPVALLGKKGIIRLLAELALSWDHVVVVEAP